mmetsp:Transcript_127379/g.220820  ORF Transcript_127379/g.220820 Transcript_127379/m.220820 type:complete len:306 (-) Transcript_127379:66-983(-)
MMRRSACFQIYLFFMSHGFRPHVLPERSQSGSSAGALNQLESLAKLLLTRRSDSAFNPCSSGACLHKVNPNSFARAQAMTMLTVEDLENIAALKEPTDMPDGAEKEDLSQLTVKDLKDRLKDAGLKVSGTKAELISRLNEAAVDDTADLKAEEEEEPMEQSEAAVAPQETGEAIEEAEASVDPQETGQVPMPDLDSLTVQELEMHARNMLHHHKQALESIDDRVYLEGLDFDVLKKVLDQHPSGPEKLGPGIERIFVACHPKHGNPCYHIQRKDGTEDDISYRKCLPRAERVMETGRDGMSQFLT